MPIRVFEKNGVLYRQLVENKGYGCVQHLRRRRVHSENSIIEILVR